MRHNTWFREPSMWHSPALTQHIQLPNSPCSGCAPALHLPRTGVPQALPAQFPCVIQHLSNSSRPFPRGISQGLLSQALYPQRLLEGLSQAYRVWVPNPPCHKEVPVPGTLCTGWNRHCSWCQGSEAQRALTHWFSNTQQLVWKWTLEQCKRTVELALPPSSTAILGF